MWNRLLLIVLGGFWLVMLGLLCWSEFGGSRHMGASISVETVWDKILTSPDSSIMSVNVDGLNIGYLQWKPTIVEGGVKSTGSEDARNLEGLIRDVVGYNLYVKSRFGFVEETNNLHFEVTVNFDPDKQWKDFDLEYRDNESLVHVRSNAGDRELVLRSEGLWKLDTRFGFDSLKNPAALIGQLDGPVAALALANFSFLPKGTNAPPSAIGLQWEARYGWIVILNQKVRCYLLETTVMGRNIRIYVSRAGELLRVELPNGFLLVNDTETRM